ncbi:MAG TPA: thioredoxin family protein [Rectinemataceae bacterium]|nr:thioredoxin family protein [Rectinemataceae bacterium]
MKVQVVGSGCAKCKLLEQHAREAVATLGLDVQVEKVTDMTAIAAMGVMSTPALAVDGMVKSAGRVLSADEIARYLA